MVLLGLLMDGGHWGLRPSQKLASLQPLSSLHLSPLRRVQPDVQQGPWKHGEMNDTATAGLYIMADMEQKRVSSCVERVYTVSSIVFFSFFSPPSFLSVFLFFFFFPGRREIRLCVRARWMRLHRFEKENSHCENAFNVYIGFQRLYCPRYRFSDLSKSSPE